MTLNGVAVGDRHRFFQAALLCSAFIFVMLLAVSRPAMASPITGVNVSVNLTKSVLSGDAVYPKATVQGTGDYDHRVNWSLSPGNAGTISPTGLFISGPAFTGAAVVKATSVENPNFSGTATINVYPGAEALHVDHNNAGLEDGSTLHPYRTIQGAVNHASASDTIKVAQGTYTENVALPMFGVLLLGGFKGGSAEDYAANIPGDFVTRSTDHLTLVTTIQSPSLNNPVVAMLENWDPLNPMTYAVDGFTLTGGANGVKVSGSGQIGFFISQNLITDNGVEVEDASAAGGGIRFLGGSPVILNNQISDNLTGWGGGIYLDLGDNSSYLIQGNLIENNRAGSDRAGGVWLTGPQGLFTWNVVRGNHSSTLLTYGYGGGVLVNAGQAELNRNVYANNATPSLGGGLHVEEAAHVVIYHELIYQNTADGGAGVCVAGENTQVAAHHCTIAGNHGGIEGNGLFVVEAMAQVSNSIIWGNSDSQLYVEPNGTLTMTYSDSDPYPGIGNISVDPLFASPATDDYHLKSKKGRWNPATSQWVRDTVQSPCIDAGNPASPYDQEPIPNAFRANLGVYGNTPEASKSLREPMFGGVLQLLLLDN